MFVFPEKCGLADLSKRKRNRGKQRQKTRQRQSRGSRENKDNKGKMKKNERKYKHHELYLSPVPHRESGATFHCQEDRHIPRAGQINGGKQGEIYQHNHSSTDKG